MKKQAFLLSFAPSATQQQEPPIVFYHSTDLCQYIDQHCHGKIVIISCTEVFFPVLEDSSNIKTED